MPTGSADNTHPQGAWLVQCLAAAGQAERATELFERATAYTNDLGLLSEEADPATGELLGNFPQAFSHVGLVNAAWALSQMPGPGEPRLTLVDPAS